MIVRKSRKDLAVEHLKKYYMDNDEVPKPMLMVQWNDFISKSIGIAPNPIREVTRLLEIEGYISISNGKVCVVATKIFNDLQKEIKDLKKEISSKKKDSSEEVKE